MIDRRAYISRIKRCTEKIDRIPSTSVYPAYEAAMMIAGCFAEPKALFKK